MSEVALRVHLWAFSADFLVLLVSFVRCCCSCAGAFFPCFLSDTIYSPHFSMHGRDKVAHVSHVPGSASFCLSHGWAPSELDSRLPFSRHCLSFRLTLLDSYLARLTLRRTAAGGNASAWLQLAAIFAFGSGFSFCGTTVMFLSGCPELAQG